MSDDVDAKRTDEILAQVGQVVTYHLNRVADLFSNDVKLTLIIRSPKRPEMKPAVFTNEDEDVDPELLVPAVRNMHGWPDGKVMDFVGGMPGKTRTKQ